MLSIEEWYRTFDDTADLIEVNGKRQFVTDQGSEYVWMACIEAVNMSGIARVPFSYLGSLLGVLQGASIKRQGDATIYQLIVPDRTLQ